MILHQGFVHETVVMGKTTHTTMNKLLHAWNRVDRNKVAAVLSVLPGLGHLYKHHYLQGLGLLLVGNVLVAFIAGLLSLGTLGLSLVLVPIAWFAGVAYSAYMASDEHGHHPWLHVWEYHWRGWFKRS